MAQHIEINPDPKSLPLSLADRAMAMARGMQTSNTGTIRVPTGNGNAFIAGKGAQDGANWIDANGKQLPLIDTSRIEAEAESASKKADEAIKQGEQIRRDAQAGIDDARKAAQDAAAKADKVRSDLQAEVGKVKANVADVDAKAEQAKTSAEAAASKADSDKAELDKSVAALDKRVSDVSAKGDKMAGQITDITGTVNGQQTKLNEFGTKLDGAITRNDTTVKSVTELKQTVTGLSSTVSQTTKTASDALSKATSVEQTANGLKATISKDYQTTKQADGKYSTKTELSATSESLSASITAVKKTADGAVTSANAAQATADGVKATLSRDYTSTKNADLKYSTKAELSAASDSLSSSISSVKGTADGAVVAASKAQQTADAATLTLSKNYQTKAQNDAVYATKTSLKATSDSLSANIAANAKTAQSAVDKATSLEANLNGFKTTVSQTYSHGSNLWVNPTFDADKPQITSLVDNVTAPNGSGVNLLASRDHFNPGTSFPVVPGHTYVITAYCKPVKGNLSLRAGIWYTKQTGGNAFDALAGAESTSNLSDGWMTATWRFTCPAGKSRGCVYFQINNWPPNNVSTQWYVANVTCTDVTGLQPAGDYATNSSLSQTADSIKASVAENARKADAAMSMASSVEQTASGLSTRISEVARKGDRTVQSLNTLSADVTGFKQTVQQTYATGARVSRLESSLDGFKSTVSQTYSPKSEVTNLAASTVRRYTLNMTDKAAWHKIGYWRPLGQGSVAAIHVYVGYGTNGREDQNSEFTIMLKKGWTGSSNNHRNDYGVNLIRQRNAANVQVKAFACHPNGQAPNTTPVDIWIYQPWGYGGGHYDVSYDGSWANMTEVRTDAPGEDSTHTLQSSVGDETLSNTSYVDQTSRSVSLGVVEEYKQGQHGSALATSADITAAKNSITSSVSSTYATKTGVTQEISSKITQNNNSLDVRFSTKTETKAAQDAANTANSHASDAQSRVGSLESCIRMTSDGVRVGHIVNGSFQGNSALVTPHGSFDVLDASGKTVATFQASTIDLLNGLVRLRNVNNTGELLIKAPDGTYGYLSYNSDGMFLKSPNGTIRLEPRPGRNVYTRSKAIQPSQSGLCNKATDANGIISVDNLSPPDDNANNGILSVTVTPINIGQDNTLLAFTPVIWAKSATGFQVRLKHQPSSTWVSGIQPYAFCWHAVWA